VDPAHDPVDLLHGLFFRKIIQYIWKIADAWNFAKTPPSFSKIVF
jgi:hypothetical protein